MIAKVKGNKIEIKDPVTLVQGTVGQTLGVELPADWEGLSVTAVFFAGAVQRDVPVLGDEITIPWEVLADPHAPLALCFHAAAGNGQRVITTANCDPIRIAPSTAPSGQEPEAPSPTRADQIQALAQQALAAAQSVSTQAAQGAFNGRDGVDGTDGTDGADGVSPAVSVSEIQGGHRIQITDAAGRRSFDVLDGAPGEVTEAELETALASKADVNGSYDDMTVGNAKQLVATVGVTDRAPYNFRTAGGSADIGDRASDKIVGGTICWNQLQANDHNKTQNGITYTFSKGALTVSGNAAGITWWCNSNSKKMDFLKDHVYLLDVGNTAYENINSNSPAVWYIPNLASQYFDRPATLKKPNATVNSYFQLQISAGADLTTPMVFHPQIFDLTQMFGSTIADYVYGLEQANAGAGVAWFRKLFPKSCYAYNAGELMSVRVSAHKTMGFNAYDHATGKAKLVGGAQYQITGAFTALSLNGESITPDANGYFTPGKSGELAVSGGDGSTTCVHLTWDGERDGEYEPYILRSYTLDSSLALRGLPKLDANNNLYYDGDIYESDGTVTRGFQYERFDGSEDEDWVLFVQSARNSFRINLRESSTAYVSLVTNGIEVSPSSEHTGNSDNSVTCRSTNYRSKSFYIFTPPSVASDVTELKAYLADHPVELVYPVAASATEEADPYQNPQIVDDFGTEEYVDYAEAQGIRDVAIPVGHMTSYQPNLRAKLEMAPSSPNGNGDYLIRQSGGTNSYVEYTDGGRITALEAKLPAPPAANGSYCLTVTVNGASSEYTWTSA